MRLRKVVERLPFQLVLSVKEQPVGLVLEHESFFDVLLKDLVDVVDQLSTSSWSSASNSVS
jgi:hypothetical protein